MSTELVKVETSMTMRGAMEQGREIYVELLERIAEKSTVDVNALKLWVAQAMKKDAKIRECTGDSLIAATLTAVQMGLVPDGRHGAFVMFGRELQFMPMYGGYIKVALESGAVTSIDADIVHEADKIEYQKSNIRTENYLRHTASLDDDPGPVIASYAIAHQPDGFGQFTVRPMRYLRKVEENAKRRGGAVWKSWPEEQQIKTAIRYLAKLLPQTPELAKVIAYDDQHFGAVDIERGSRPAEPEKPVKAAITEALSASGDDTNPADDTLFPDGPEWDGPTEQGGD